MTFDYENVSLIPNKCIVQSRNECDTTAFLGDFSFKLPVVPANMQTVIDEELCIYLASRGYFYIMHRFEPEKRFSFVQKMKAKGLIASISLGVKSECKQLLRDLKDAKLEPEFITIDIAHGHSDSAISMLKEIKTLLPNAFIIAGNLATPAAVRELEIAGADATKIGVGPGKVCITRLKTGFGTGGWQLAALASCAKAARKPLIADGGIRHHGDIAKSIRFGASFCMIGSLFAGHDESPGGVFSQNGMLFKEYFGSASEQQKGERKNVEGKRILIEAKGPLQDTLDAMKEDLQSAISYAGGKDLEALRKVDYVLISGFLE